MTFEEFWKQRLKELSIKSDLSQNEISSIFKKSLDEVEAEYNTITLVPLKEPEFIEVIFDDKKNIILRYNVDMLKTLSVEEVEVLLLHESCHVATLPTTYIKIPDTGGKEQQQLLIDYLQAYDEYIGHLEFVNRFKEDEKFNTFSQYQKNNFNNFSDIINSLRITKESNPWKVFHFLYSIIYDAIFFFIVNDDSYKAWCAENKIDSLYTLSEWIFNDFEIIRNLGISYDEERDYIIQSGVLSWSINPLKLLHINALTFADTAEKMHKDLIERGQVVELAMIWEDRRVSVVGDK